MRRATRGLACLGSILVALALCGQAVAAQPRIIHGSPADPGEYPAHGFLQFTRPGGTFICGGSLVSNRQFLTAAHCATLANSTTPLAPTAFTVTLGKTNRDEFTPSDQHSVAVNQVNGGYDPGGPDNDVAVLTLSTPAPAALEPVRLLETDETALWQADATATIVGWGVTESGSTSRLLLEATVPMKSDAFCGGAAVWGTAFHPASMVCAGGGDTDTCGGDSGGPLMVSDGAFLVLAGLTSWGADPCAKAGIPGVYTRLGAPALNSWVRARVPMARASVSDATVDPGDDVTFSVTANNPAVPDYFTDFAWDFDSDGTVDANGASVTHAYPADGAFVARVVASGDDVDTATDKVAVQVGDPTPTPTAEPTPVPTAEPTAGPAPAPLPPLAPTPRPAGASGRLATVLVSGRPRVRRGRFSIRIDFAATAPSGTAVIEVFRGKRKIGSARARVRRGGSRRVVVKLTKTGKRLLSRSAKKRLKVKVQVRVKRQVLRSKTVTIRQ